VFMIYDVEDEPSKEEEAEEEKELANDRLQ
jgi:hypothetical protein